MGYFLFWERQVSKFLALVIFVSILEYFSCLTCKVFKTFSLKLSLHQILFKLKCFQVLGLNVKIFKFNLYFQKQYYLVIHCAKFH